MGRKEGRDGPKWPAPAKINAGAENGRRWDERKGRDGPKWPAHARITGGEWKMERKECRDGPKWPAPAKIRGDRVQGGKWEKVGRTKVQRRA